MPRARRAGNVVEDLYWIGVGVVAVVVVQHVAAAGHPLRQLARVLLHRVHEAVAVAELFERAVGEVARVVGVVAGLRRSAQRVGRVVDAQAGRIGLHLQIAVVVIAIADAPGVPALGHHIGLTIQHPPLVVGVGVALLFDADERDPSDDLRLHFEAVGRMSAEDRQVVRSLLEGMILKHDAKRFMRSDEHSP
jgi:hypothetical protein